MTWRRSDLRIYQRFLVEKIKLSCHHDAKKRIPGVIAALEPGAGKTGATLTALLDLLNDLTIRKALIVAPLLVAQTTWPDEFDEWEHLRSMTRTLLRVEDDDAEVNSRGDAVYAESLARYQAEMDLEREINQMICMTPAEARKAARAAAGAAPSARAEQDRIVAVAAAKEAKLRRLAESDTEIHIINKEALRWLWDYFGRGARWPYDVIVIDDVRETRSGKKRVKRDKEDGDKKAKAPLSRFGILAAARKHVMATIVLTGTPTPKGLEDLWGLAYLIDLGARLLPFKTRFLKRWFHVDTRTFKAEPRDYAFKEIMPRVKDVMFSLDPKDYPQLPPYVVDPIRVRLPDDMLKRYRKFKRDLVDAEADIEAVNAGVLHGKLLQFCIAEGTPVLTTNGWKPIETVSSGDQVWDGVEWVACSGAVAKGHRSVVDCYGVRMTPDHEVLTERGWAQARHVIHGEPSKRPLRANVRLPDCYRENGICSDRTRQEREGDLEGALHLRDRGRSPEPKSSKYQQRSTEVVRLSPRRGDFARSRRSRDDGLSPVGHLAGDASALPRSEGRVLPKLRRARHRHARALVSFVRGFLGGRADWICRRSDDRPNGQQRQLQQVELPLDHSEGATTKHTGEPDRSDTMGPDDGGRGGRARGSELPDGLSASEGRLHGGSPSWTADEVATFDLVDCGPRSRFVVSGDTGPLIVHNCNGSMYNENGDDVWLHDLKIEALKTLVERMNGVPLLVAYTYQFDVDRIMKAFPKAVHLRPENASRVVREWNEDKIPLLLCHRASAGHGLNLQRGTGHMCEYGLTSDAELYLQFLKRIWRPGRKGTLFNHVIIAEGTIDEDIFPEYLDPKIALQERVMKEVQVDLELEALLG